MPKQNSKFMVLDMQHFHLNFINSVLESLKLNYKLVSLSKLKLIILSLNIYFLNSQNQ